MHLTQVAPTCSVREPWKIIRAPRPSSRRASPQRRHGRAYLVQLRWPDGFRCPHCGSATAWPVRTVRWQCAGCGRQTSVTAGTLLQDTRTPLTTWFRAMWYVTSAKTGTSALALQQVLGLGSYRTAWTWLHKLRRAMVRPGRERLSGHVEVDESFVGGLGGAPGRSTATKALIVVGAEAVGRGTGRVRMRRIPDASAESLGAFISDAIEPGTDPMRSSPAPRSTLTVGTATTACARAAIGIA